MSTDFLKSIPADADPARNQADTPLGRAASAAVGIKAGYTPAEIRHLKEQRSPAAIPIEVTLVIEEMSDVKAEITQWLWPQKFPLNVLIGFWGNPGNGKTTASIDAIARITTGREWPDGTPNVQPPSTVLMMSAEDDYGTTIKPRLIAAGAEMSKVKYVAAVKIAQGAKQSDRHFALDTDISALRSALRERPDIRAVVIDPVTSYLGAKSMNKEQEVRAVLEPLRDLCLELKVTIFVLGHFNKRVDVDAMQRVGGAMAWIGVPRASWAFGTDPDTVGQYLMTQLKVNSARDKTGMHYAIEEKQVPNVGGQPILKWLGKTTKTADDMVTRKDPQDRKMDKAVAFLREFLKDGAKMSDDVVAAGAELGIGERTLFSAKTAAGVKPKREKGHWWWKLEPIASEPDELERPF